MTNVHKAEIKAMSANELAASIRIVSCQLAAKLFLGDKENRKEVLSALQAEAVLRKGA